MLAVVMTKARSLMRAPQLSQCSTSILKLLMSSSRQGRYPERWVGGVSLAVQVHGGQYGWGGPLRLTIDATDPYGWTGTEILRPCLKNILLTSRS